MGADLKIAGFQLDATPPQGHPLCGGWITPVVGVDDRTTMRGVTILGTGDPIVLATLDWTGILNESHDAVRRALAEGAGTTMDRVTVHCVHQHNAPFVDQLGSALLKQIGASNLIHDETYYQGLLQQAKATVQASLKSAQPVNRIRVGQAKIDQVACNRRVIGPNGKLLYSRTSATRDPKARAMPDGTIDPILKSVSFFNQDRLVARFYYYTTHPMSYYGDGRVSSDFVGLARYRRQITEPGATHLYFTGCAGNVTAGKYNDGSHINRAILADRIEAGMIAADRNGDQHDQALDQIRWVIEPMLFPVRPDLNIDQSMAIVRDEKQQTANRNRNAMIITWLKRIEAKKAINLTKLDLGTASLIHLPAETFVEYQLAAQTHFQAKRPGQTLAVAAYGDGGPWYIPIAQSYNEGGYEPSVSFVSQNTEPLYKAAINKLALA